MVEEVNKFMYVGSEINSEGKISGAVSKKIVGAECLVKELSVSLYRRARRLSSV
jgi:hypothetical protein